MVWTWVRLGTGLCPGSTSFWQARRRDICLTFFIHRDHILQFVSINFLVFGIIANYDPLSPSIKQILLTGHHSLTMRLRKAKLEILFICICSVGSLRNSDLAWFWRNIRRQHCHICRWQSRSRHSRRLQQSERKYSKTSIKRTPNWADTLY